MCKSGWKRSCYYELDLEAGKPGNVTVEVRGQDGVIVDQAKFRFEKAESARFVATKFVPVDDGHTYVDDELQGPLKLNVDEQVRVTPRLWDASGTELVIGQSLDWTVSPAAAHILSCTPLCDDTSVTVVGDKPGISQLTLRADGVEEELRIDVR
jgi:hypothetical protein